MSITSFNKFTLTDRENRLEDILIQRDDFKYEIYLILNHRSIIIIKTKAWTCRALITSYRFSIRKEYPKWKRKTSSSIKNRRKPSSSPRSSWLISNNFLTSTQFTPSACKKCKRRTSPSCNS
jgi:hypothetical protein